MVNKQVALELAAFLDSESARSLESPGPEAVKKLAGIFLELCYESVGTRPARMDGGELHTVLGHLMPGRLKRRDPLAEHVPAVLGAYLDHLEVDQVVPQIFELRQALEGTTQEFLETVRTGENAHHGHHAVRQDPVVHHAPKTGRNDPCPCGSGKKFKKCHGKAG